MPPRRRPCSSPSSSSSDSSYETRLRYLYFPNRSFLAAPPSHSSNFIFPDRPFKPPPCILLPHPLFPGIYVAGDNEAVLYTRNLLPGLKTLDNDVLISVEDEYEYREWDPYTSRLAAAILTGLKNIWIQPGSRVLVLYSRDDHQFGITISHLSDIVGPQGMVYVVETSSCQTLVDMAHKRSNILPIIHSTSPWQYRMLINLVDVLFAAVDSLEEVRRACLNATYFLKTGGHYVFYVQANGIASTNQADVDAAANRGDIVFSSREKGLRVQFMRMEQVLLEPFARDHAYISGVFRTLEIDGIEPSCLVSNKFWTEDSHRADDDDRPISLYEKQKNLPVFMLFESACGYLLFRPHNVYKVERTYVAIEEYIQSFDQNFEFIASHIFESSDEAMMYLTADSNDTLPEKLMEFLVLHLPPAMKDDEHCYTLAVFNPCITDDLVSIARISCSTSPFHIDIMRGVKMNIEKFYQEH